MPDVRNEIIDNLQIRGSVSGGGLGGLAKSVRVAMNALTSGAGALIAYSDNVFLNNTSHVLFFRCSAAWSSATKFYLSNRQASTSVNGSNIVCTSGTLRIEARNTSSGANTVFGSSTQTIPVADNTIALIAYEMDLQSDGSGIVRWYVNGAKLGADVTITAVQLGYYWQGVTNTYFNRATDGTGVAADYIERGFYNRTLTAAEHLSLYNNGPSLADLGASQTAVYTSDFSAGVDGLSASNVTAAGNIDGIEGEDNWYRGYPSTTSNLTRTLAFTPSSGGIFSRASRAQWLQISFKYFVPAGQTNTNGVRLIAINTGDSGASETPAVEVNLNTTGAVATYSGYLQMPSNWNGLLYWQLTKNSSPTFAGVTSGTDDLAYIKDIVVKVCGVTGWWDARDAQSDTGQILDSSGNKNHAMLPASGATVIGKPMSEARQVRWTNTWTGTQELQYIGGVNQAVLPAKAYIESIVGIVSGATVEDIIIGDGSDTDRYVTITTGLAAGTVTFTLANRTTDGTNLKLTVDPDANATMSIIWTVTYRILE